MDAVRVTVLDCSSNAGRITRPEFVIVDVSDENQTKEIVGTALEQVE